MAKVTLTFKLPDEAYEFKQFKNAEKLSRIVSDFTNIIRTNTKYGDGKKVQWQTVSDLWWRTLKDEEYDPYAD